MVALLALVMGSCAKTTTPDQPDNGNGQRAYLSIKANFQSGTRGSDEIQVAGESTLSSLYIVTFNETNQIVGIPGPGASFYIKIEGSSTTPPVQLVSSATKKIMVVANPGTGVLAALNALSSTSTFDSFNAAVTNTTVLDIYDATNGFTMISTPPDVDASNVPLAVGATITNALIAVPATSIKVVSETLDEEAAKAAAAAARVPVDLERLASKVVLKSATPGTILPAGAAFSFLGWTVDAVNTTYFPWSVKTLMGAAHTAGSYARNFYTQDPNYVDNNLGGTSQLYHSGIAYATINNGTGGDYAPILPWTSSPTYPNGYYGWMTAAATSNAYLVENTMIAAAQRYGNATRVVIKGTYTPVGFTAGEDWFNWAGVNYPDFAALKAAYAAIPSSTVDSPLRDACDDFYARVKAYLGTGTTAANFAALTTADLDLVPNGGEVVKDGKNPVIRWYQNGLNYYYYEIKHNNDENGTMAQNKYGVVRNNWYDLTLDRVSGPGTPWYPDLTNPGEGDPDPWDPIDEESGWIGIIVEPQPWILWETGITI